MIKGLATNAPRSIVDFELGVVNLGENTFFDVVLLAEEFGSGMFSLFSSLYYTISFVLI